MSDPRHVKVRALVKMPHLADLIELTDECADGNGSGGFQPPLATHSLLRQRLRRAKIREQITDLFVTKWLQASVAHD